MSLLGALKKKLFRQTEAPPPGDQVINIDPVQLIVAQATAILHGHDDTISSFYKAVDPAEYLKADERGAFSIHLSEITPAQAVRARLEGVLGHRWMHKWYDEVPRRSVALRQEGSGLFGNVIADNSTSNLRGNGVFVARAHGRVLLAGLGIGLCTLAAQRKSEVSEILVVEKYQEVIDLVAPQLPLGPKVKIVLGDIFEWLPGPEERFDTAWFALNIGDKDYYPAMLGLRRRFLPYMNEQNAGRWIGIQHEGLQYLLRQAYVGIPMLPYEGYVGAGR